MNNVPTASAATKGKVFFQKTRQIGQNIFLRELFDYVSNIQYYNIITSFLKIIPHYLFTKRL